MRVDFVVRSDAASKPGGDMVQVEEYTRRLTSRGWDVLSHPYSTALRLRQGSVVHVVNVDRPYDYLDTCRQAGPRPVVVSPIHHQLAAVRQMRKAETGQGVRSAVGRLPEAVRELLAHVARTVRDGHPGPVRVAAAAARASVLAPGVWRRVGLSLDAAAAVALLAEGEGRDLTVDTGWGGRNGAVVPNGLATTSAPAAPWSSRPVGIVVVGRVEPRKRQLEVARLAAAAGMPVTFVGPVVPATPYGAEFLHLLEKHPGLTYLGAMPHDDVLTVMQRSRVLLNASWVEVQSLVDLEAAAAGCWVVANDRGHSAEWLGDTCRQVSDISAAVAAAHGLSQHDSPPPRLAYGRTWDDAVDALEGIYRAASAPGALTPGDAR